MNDRHRWWTSFVIIKAASALLLLICGLCLFTPLLAKGQTPDNALLFWSRRAPANAVYALDARRLLAGRLLNAPPDVLVLAPPAISNNAQTMTFETLSDDAHLGIAVLEQGGSVLYSTVSGFEDRLARISPDGSQVAFLSNREGNWRAYVMNSDGSQLRPITTHTEPQTARSLQWSPDQRWLMLRTWQTPGLSNYWLLDMMAGEAVTLPRVADLGRELAWSPDGHRIAFRTARDHNVEIYVYDVQTGQTANVTLNPASDFQPTWSPDSRHLAFVSDRAGRGDIYMVDTNCLQQGVGCQQAAQRITSSGAWNPLWSPDGRYMAFFSRQDGASAVYVMHSDGSGSRRISDLDDDWVFLGWVS